MIQNPDRYDEDKDNTNKTKELVEFVLAGAYEWTDKTKPNILQNVVKAEGLTTIYIAPERCVNTIALTTVCYQKKSSGAEVDERSTNSKSSALVVAVTAVIFH